MAGKGYSCDDEGFAYDGGRVLHALSDTYALVDGHVTAISTRSHRNDTHRHVPLQRALNGRDHTRVVIVPKGAPAPPKAMFDDTVSDDTVRNRCPNKHVWIGHVTSNWRGAGYLLPVSDERKHQLRQAAERAHQTLNRHQLNPGNIDQARHELVTLAETCGTDRVTLLLDSIATSGWQADHLNAAVLRCRFDLPSMRDEADTTRPQLETLGPDAKAAGLRHGTRLSRRLNVDRDDITVHAIARWLQRVDTTLNDTGIADLDPLLDQPGDNVIDGNTGTLETIIGHIASTVDRDAVDRIVNHIAECLNDPDRHRGWLPGDEHVKPGSIYVQIPAGPDQTGIGARIANLVLERDLRNPKRYKVVTCYIPSRSLNGRRVNLDDYGAFTAAVAQRKRNARINQQRRREHDLGRLDKLLVTATETAVHTAR